MDNRNVIPYNKQLLYKLNCHINVEISTSISSVKSTFKYVFKGYDCVGLEVPKTTNDGDLFMMRLLNI